MGGRRCWYEVQHRIVDGDAVERGVEDPVRRRPQAGRHHGRADLDLPAEGERYRLAVGIGDAEQWGGPRTGEEDRLDGERRAPRHPFAVRTGHADRQVVARSRREVGERPRDEHAARRYRHRLGVVETHLGAGRRPPRGGVDEPRDRGRGSLAMLRSRRRPMRRPATREGSLMWSFRDPAPPPPWRGGAGSWSASGRAATSDQDSGSEHDGGESGEQDAGHGRRARASQCRGSFDGALTRPARPPSPPPSPGPPRARPGRRNRIRSPRPHAMDAKRARSR